MPLRGGWAGESAVPADALGRTGRAPWRGGTGAVTPGITSSERFSAGLAGVARSAAAAGVGAVAVAVGGAALGGTRAGGSKGGGWS